MKKFIRIWINRQHPGHYWALIVVSWVVVLIGAFPVLAWTWGSDSIWPFALLYAPAFLAHGYGFASNVRQLRDWQEPRHVGPAAIGVAYLVASLISLVQIDPFFAFSLPIAGVGMAVMTFSIMFPGFAPLLGLVIVYLLLRKTVSAWRLGLAITVMTAAWLVSVTTAWFLLNL